METLRSFRIANFAIVDFIGVILVAELVLYIRGGAGGSVKRRLVYYLFIFILGIIVHDLSSIKTQISLDP